MMMMMMVRQMKMRGWGMGFGFGSRKELRAKMREIRQDKAQEQQKNIKVVQPVILNTTLAVKYGISFQFQKFLIAIPLASTIISIIAPISTPFYISVIALDRLTAALLILNLNLSKQRWMNGVIFTSIIGLNFLSTIMDPTTIAVQFFEGVLMLGLNSSTKTKEVVSEEQFEQQKSMMQGKGLVIFGLSIVIIAKIGNYAQRKKIQDRIEGYNKESRRMSQNVV